MLDAAPEPLDELGDSVGPNLCPRECGTVAIDCPDPQRSGLRRVDEHGLAYLERRRDV